MLKLIFITFQVLQICSYSVEKQSFEYAQTLIDQFSRIPEDEIVYSDFIDNMLIPSPMPSPMPYNMNTEVIMSYEYFSAFPCIAKFESIGKILMDAIITNNIFNTKPMDLEKVGIWGRFDPKTDV